MTVRILLFSAVCLLLFSSGQTADTYENPTLDSLIMIALGRNPNIHAATHQQKAADYNAASTGLLPDPMLTAGFINLPRTSFSLDETPMTGFVLGLSQSIPWPGKISTWSNIARLQSENRAADLDYQRNRLVRLITIGYYHYAYLKLAEDILTENLHLLDNIIAVVRTRYANGRGTAQALLRVQTEKSRLENRLLMVVQKRSSALLDIARLADNPETASESIAVYLPPIPTDTPIDNVAEATPLLAGAAIRSSLAEQKLGLAKSGYWPDLVFGVDYRIRKNIPMDPVRGEDFLSFKVGLKLPLWFFKRQRNETAAAKKSYQAAQARERSLKNDLEQKAADIALILKSLRERTYGYDENILPRARAAGEAAQTAYENGLIDFDGYLISQLEIMNIELEKLELIRQYHQQSAILRELTTDRYEVRK